MSDANTKLKEAQFFIELLEALEKRGDSLTNVVPPVEEASFLLSAILNSFYSVTEHAKSIISLDKVQEFKDSFPLFYKGRQGLRNMTVHEKHIGVDHEGYKPPIGKVSFSFRPEPKLSKHKTGTANLSLVSYFYLEVDGEFKRITELCYEHYYKLCKFVKNTV
ncbi:MAG: hypothetical protein U1F59_00835 [Candidatus Competibacteraceae bacterium]